MISNSSISKHCLNLALTCVLLGLFSSCKDQPYREDISLLKEKCEVIELVNQDEQARLAISPTFQGKVLTSTNRGENGIGFGWLNRDNLSKRKQLTGGEVGGEERLWIGPLGGQYSFYYQHIKPLHNDNWHVPSTMHNEPYLLIEHTPTKARLQKSMSLTNFVGTRFDLLAEKEIQLLSYPEIEKSLDLGLPKSVNTIGYKVNYCLTNLGSTNWSQEKGLASIWSMSMLKATPKSTCYIPLNKRCSSSDIYQYFGTLDKKRMHVNKQILTLKTDGRYRTKIGIPPTLAKNIIISHSPEQSTLHIMRFEKHKGDRYFNSKVEVQENPYKGEIIPIYNNGISDKETKGDCSFYELENIAPMVELSPNETTTHWVQIFHISGKKNELETVLDGLLK